MQYSNGDSYDATDGTRLTADQERYLLQRTQAACIAARDQLVGWLDYEYYQQCLKDAITAREQLVTFNTRLVQSVAKRYRNLARGFTLPDLVQEGMLGLLRAMDRFDLTRDTRLSTYAVPWIKQAVLEAIWEQGQWFRVPAETRKRLMRYITTVGKLQDQLGREPSVDEIALAVGESGQTVAEMQHLIVAPTSLDLPVSDDGDALVDLMPGDPSSDPEEIAAEGSLVGRLYEVMRDDLEPQQRLILALRNGLGSGRQHSPEEVAGMMDISPAEVDAARRSGLAKLPPQGDLVKMSFSDLNKALKDLTVVEKVAVILCCGLCPAHGMQIADVAVLLNMRRERVQKIENEAKRTIGRLMADQFHDITNNTMPGGGLLGWPLDGGQPPFGSRSGIYF